MRIKQFEHLCRRLAQQMAEPSAAETEAAWQQLVHRLDRLQPGTGRADFLTSLCVDRPGPHGQLTKQPASASGLREAQPHR
ncbi:hypothetical protein [Hymenobacter persicinus]|uniref:Uncharacterized protein n=1 Tax=Hymenobacter persicinus TaxID=2025506 RepID=A0A4V1ZBB9_9BACT|nr:hypothetical protein [Hymenobacter persicinus]RYU84841.1 hypothetical protein EWM57_00515 [Hymenobacter persicinus]